MDDQVGVDEVDLEIYSEIFCRYSTYFQDEVDLDIHHEIFSRYSRNILDEVALGTYSAIKCGWRGIKTGQNPKVYDFLYTYTLLPY